MKRVPILMLLMAFVSFATMDSFADSSPPWAEISISYELPQGIDVNFESQDAQVWYICQKNQLSEEGRIAVYHCDLKCWPNFNDNTIINNTNIGVLNKGSIESFLQEGLYVIKLEDQFVKRITKYPIERLSLFYNSNGERYAARNAIT